MNRKRTHQARPSAARPQPLRGGGTPTALPHGHHWIAAGLLALGALQPIPAAALGIGAAEFHSHLGEPLRLRLPVLLDGTEASRELEARLLPASAYAPLGLEPPRLDPGALDLRLISDGDGIWLEMQSSRRVLEPLVVLLLEARLGSVRIIRELTLLLEPPPNPEPVAPEQPAVATPAARLNLPAPVPAETPRATPPSAESGSAEPSRAERSSVEAPPARTVADAGRYGPVVAGETLRQIAERVRPEPKYGIRRVMTALLLANPEAFDSASRQPRIGAELRVPSPREMLDLSDETITATVGPRRGAAAVAAPQLAPRLASVRPVVEPPSDPDPARTPADAPAMSIQRGLRLSLQLLPASRDLLIEANLAQASVEGGAAGTVAERVDDAASDEAGQVQIPEALQPEGAGAGTDADLDESLLAGDATAGAGVVAAERSPGGWWLFALIGLAAVGAAGWWRRGRALAQTPRTPAMPTPARVVVPAPVPQRVIPAAPSRDAPVRMRLVGGSKAPEIVVLEQRMARLGAKPGASQRTLTLISAYLDNGNVDMARELLDELEAPPPMRGLG